MKPACIPYSNTYVINFQICGLHPTFETCVELVEPIKIIYE